MQHYQRGKLSSSALPSTESRRCSYVTIRTPVYTVENKSRRQLLGLPLLEVTVRQRSRPWFVTLQSSPGSSGHCSLVCDQNGESEGFAWCQWESPGRFSIKKSLWLSHRSARRQHSFACTLRTWDCITSFWADAKHKTSTSDFEVCCCHCISN